MAQVVDHKVLLDAIDLLQSLQIDPGIADEHIDRHLEFLHGVGAGDNRAEIGVITGKWAGAAFDSRPPRGGATAFGSIQRGR
jgi:hypothetical protein